MLVVVPPLQENKMTFLLSTSLYHLLLIFQDMYQQGGTLIQTTFFTGMEIRIRSGSKFIFILNHKLLGTKRSIFGCQSVLHISMPKAFRLKGKNKYLIDEEDVEILNKK